MAALRLEVFESSEPVQEPVAPPAANADQESRLEAYEQGYRAGWEDAAAAHAEDQRRIRVDLARSLQALGFTYQEARSHVLKSLAPLMQDMVGKLLPEMAREALAPTVLETLMPLAEQLADEPVTLVVNAGDRRGRTNTRRRTGLSAPRPSGSAYRSCPRHGRNCGCCAGLLWIFGKGLSYGRHG